MNICTELLYNKISGEKAFYPAKKKESISLWLCTTALFFLCYDCWKSYTGKSNVASISSLYPQFFVSKWLSFWSPCSEDKYRRTLSSYKPKFTSYSNLKESKILRVLVCLGHLLITVIHPLTFYLSHRPFNIFKALLSFDLSIVI